VPEPVYEHWPYHVVAPASSRGFAHYVCNPNNTPPPWRLDDAEEASWYTFKSTSLISNTLNIHRGPIGLLNVFGRAGNNLHYFYKEADAPHFTEPGMPQTVSAGGPAGFIQGTYGANGKNLELVSVNEDNTMSHWWIDQSHGVSMPPSDATFGQDITAAALILSDFGNLEVVAVTKNGTLQHWWRQEGGWRTDVTFGSNGVLQGSLGFVQDANGFFQVVVAETGGGLRHYWRERNSQYWSASAQTFGSGITSASMILSTNGRLNVVGLQGSQLVHFERVGETWKQLSTFGANIAPGSGIGFIQDTLIR
jgi:hypothetical protein